MQLYKQQSSTPFPFPAPPPPISKFRYCCEVHYTYLGFGLVVETTRYENNSLVYNSFKCQYNIAQYCRWELCCRFPYTFRFPRQKTD